MSARGGSGLEGWSVVGASALALCVVVAGVFDVHGTGSEGWRMQIRATARLSGALFLAAYLAAPLRRLRPDHATAWLLRNRTGLHYLWLVFGSTFAGTALAGDPVSAAYAGAYGLALPLRWWGLRGRGR